MPKPPLNFIEFADSLGEIIYLNEKFAREISSTIIFSTLLSRLVKGASELTRSKTHYDELNDVEPVLYLGYSLITKTISSIPVTNHNMLLQLINQLSTVELVINACFYLLLYQKLIVANELPKVTSKPEDYIEKYEKGRQALKTKGYFRPYHFMFDETLKKILANEKILLLSGTSDMKETSIKITRLGKSRGLEENFVPIMVKDYEVSFKHTPYVYAYIDSKHVQNLTQFTERALNKSGIKSIILGKLIMDMPYDIPVPEEAFGTSMKSIDRSITVAAIFKVSD